MIYFAISHVNGIIACTDPTSSQIIGLAGVNYPTANLVDYDPFDQTQKQQAYDYFLINVPGKSGSPDVEPSLRVPNLILEGIYNSTIVYTNGESYILGHSYSP
jgi:hypothetical protein